MRDEIKESVKRMTKEDCADVAATCGLSLYSKKAILSAALADESVAAYVIQY